MLKKRSCDRRAANAKAVIRRYVNEGHDVTTAEEMKKAIDTMQKTKSMVKVVDTVENIDIVKSTTSIPGITQYYNFNYEETGVRVWQAYSIGEGKVIPFDKTEQPLSKELTVHKDWTDFTFKEFQNGKIWLSYAFTISTLWPLC